jgi:hypothetical protein
VPSTCKRNASAVISSASKRPSFRPKYAPRLPNQTILQYKQLKPKSQTCESACEYGQSLVGQRRRCEIASCHAEHCSRPTSTGRIENVNSIAITTYSCATHQRSSPAPQSAPPSAQNTNPDSHITPSRYINNLNQNHVHTILTTACKYGQYLVRQRRRCEMNPCHAERSSRPTSTGRIENVNGVFPTICCCATLKESSPAPQSAPPSAQNTPPDSHIKPSRYINNLNQNHVHTSHTTACEYGQSL